MTTLVLNNDIPTLQAIVDDPSVAIAPPVPDATTGALIIDGSALDSNTQVIVTKNDTGPGGTVTFGPNLASDQNTLLTPDASTTRVVSIDDLSQLTELRTGEGVDVIDLDGVVPNSGLTVITGAGNDFVSTQSTAGNFFVHTGEGRDVVATSAAGAVVTGAGDDNVVTSGSATINTGDGNDQIISTGTGNITTGAGSDTVQVSGGQTITDFDVNNDTLIINDSGTALSRQQIIDNMADVGGNATVTLSDGSEVTFEGVTTEQFDRDGQVRNTLLDEASLQQTQSDGSSDNDLGTGAVISSLAGAATAGLLSVLIAGFNHVHNKRDLKNKVQEQLVEGARSVLSSGTALSDVELKRQGRPDRAAAEYIDREQRGWGIAGGVTGFFGGGSAAAVLFGVGALGILGMVGLAIAGALMFGLAARSIAGSIAESTSTSVINEQTADIMGQAKQVQQQIARQQEAANAQPNAAKANDKAWSQHPNVQPNRGAPGIGA